MIAAARARAAPVGHEFTGGEPRPSRVLVKPRGVDHRLAPGFGGMDVHLDHARVGRDLNDVETRVDRRLITFDMQLEAGLLGGLLHGGEQV